MRLDAVRGFVFDVDGTLVQRSGERTHVQPGAREVLARIRGSGRPLVLFTNGSHSTPEEFAAGLREAGLDVADDELLTPLVSVQSYLRTARSDGSVLLFGSDHARDYLLRAGVAVLDDGVDRAGAVFVATPGRLDFEKVERAARAVLAGARLLTASFARAYAGADGPIFSRGAMLAAALAKATGVRPTVVGKPSRAALRTIGERLGARTEVLAVIGDDLGMDVALGRLGGARTILVCSGISGRVDLDRIPERRRPDAVVDGVAELLDRL